MKTEQEQANKEQMGQNKNNKQPDDRLTTNHINNHIKYKWSKYPQLKEIVRLDFKNIKHKDTNRIKVKG